MGRRLFCQHSSCTHSLPSLSYSILVCTCKDAPEQKKMAATVKVYKWHDWNVCVGLVKGLHELYQALPGAPMGIRPFTLLESITKVQETGKSLKWANCLPSFFIVLSSLSVSQASTIMAEAITTIQMQKKKASINHWVLHSMFIVIFRTSNYSWVLLSTLMLMLSAVRHFVIIYSEHMFRFSLPWKIKTATAKVRCYNAKQREGV